MKKLLVVAALAGTAVVGWRWRHEPVSSTDGSRKGNLIANRFWLDHLPQGEKDTVHVFALWAPESFGVFADQNHWRVELERFRYEAKGDTVHAVFPLSGAREDIALNATRCHDADWDFCLEVRGSSHGTTRYYSRLGWSGATAASSSSWPTSRPRLDELDRAGLPANGWRATTTKRCRPADQRAFTAS